MDVCTHRRNGEVCIITLCFRLRTRLYLVRLCEFDMAEVCELLSFCSDCVPLSDVLGRLVDTDSRAWSKLAILTPRARDCVHPPYVNGGS